MTERNDHDILVQLDTKVDLMITAQAEFIASSTSNVKERVERIVRLEVKDSRDSEKVASINADVQRSLNNSARITDAFVSIENLRIEIAKIIVEKTNLQSELVELKGKSFRWD